MRLRIAVVAAASLTFVAGCTDPAVVTSEPTSFGNTRDGAIIGGVLGAATGLITGDSNNRVRNMAVGAAIGAGVGGAVGNRLDRQEAALRQDLGNGNVEIVNDGSRLVVTLPQDILFPVSGAALQPGVVPDLQAVARNLNQFPDGIVQVVGHTDNTGAVDYNFALSQRRAQAVTDVLVDAGVPPARIQTIGRGDDQPRASNLTPEGRALNRRTEIVIIPSST